MAKPHWSFWIIGILALVWNFMGGLNFAMQLHPDQLSKFPEEYRSLIENRPFWATLAFAVSVVGGTVGALLLLLRKAVAREVFISALLATCLAMISVYGASVQAIISTGSAVVMAILLVYYTGFALKREWLSKS